MDRIAILAGGGNLPLVLADSIAAHGGQAHLVAVRGEAGPQVETYPHTWVTWGAVNAILATLKRHSNGTMMIAGSVSRPDLLRLSPDFGVIRHLPQVLAMLKGGDDAVLTRLIRFFEAQGLTVKGVGDVAPQLLAETGTFGGPGDASASIADQVMADTALGHRVLDVLADLDVGQAVAVERGRILAIEGVEGTDRMLSRLDALGGRGEAGGVLIKGPKRGQDLRVDMPTVGAQTIDRLTGAHLQTLVITAGQTLLLDRDEMIRRATAARMTVQSVTQRTAPDTTTTWVPGDDWSAAVLGRLVPSVSDGRDARTAAEVVRRLAPFDTGRAAVVIRDHVLAAAAAEGPLAMAERVATLRQWDSRRFKRRRGATALAFDPQQESGDGLGALLQAFANAGVAGVAIVTPTAKLFHATATATASHLPASAIAAADRLGLFLIDLAVTGCADVTSHSNGPA